MAEHNDPRTYYADGILFTDDFIRIIRKCYGPGSVTTQNLYLNWLFTGHFPVKKDEQAEHTTDDSADDDDEEVTIPYDSEMETLALLYVFAHKIEDQKCMDAVANAFVAKLKEDPNYLPCEPCIYDIFQVANLSESGLGKLFTTMYAHEASLEQLEAIFRQTKENFHTAVAIELAKLRDEKRIKVVDMETCQFHEHAADKPCEKGHRPA